MAANPERELPHLREFAHSLPMALLNAREAAMARFRPMLRRHGLTEQQWRVVRLLADRPDLDAGEIARRTLLLAPSLTRILQFLEKRRLVRRAGDSSDQRRAMFALTGKGQSLFDAIAPESEAIYAAIERAYGAERLADLYALLEAFSASLERAALNA